MAKTGIELYGRVDLNKLGGISYQVQAGEMDIDSDGGISVFTNGQADIDINDVDLEKTYAAALKWDEKKVEAIMETLYEKGWIERAN